MKILEKLGKQMLFFEGAMGTNLQKKGLGLSELGEEWNLSHPDVIRDIHLSYLKAGSNVIKLNTFGANAFKFPDREKLQAIIEAAFSIAKEAISLSGRCDDIYIALDVGPCGKLLKPLGTLDFEDAVRAFSEVCKIGESLGCDLILLETFNDLYETKAALLAAKEATLLPVFVCNAYDVNQKLMTGADAKAVAACLEGLGADAIGLNCSFGPGDMKPIVQTLSECSSLPIMVCPNAGLPKIQDGKTVFDIDPEEFARIMCELASFGIHAVGGCCGTDDSYIKTLVDAFSDYTPSMPQRKNITVVSSNTHAVEIGARSVIVGERINPTGKKRFKEALRQNDMDYILNEALLQEEAGADILDVNVGLPEIDEADMMQRAVYAISASVDLPLQIDTTNPDALERALRIYCGKAMINSVNGTKESMDTVFPLVKKYGGVVVALTLDEDGIPESCDGRFKIAQKIYAEAAKYGIEKKDIIVDALAMTISTDKNGAKVTLDTVDMIKKDGGKTILGVSNISFGLPQRDFINSSFYTLALRAGLDAAIINPLSVEMTRAYRCYMALGGYDENCKAYIDFASSVSVDTSVKKESSLSADGGKEELGYAIAKGLGSKAGRLAEAALLQKEPLELINSDIIPALDLVGKAFEEGRLYLPQLLMSADAASAAFEAVKNYYAKNDVKPEPKCSIVLATVKGDIHDIGKNIVKVLLESYGFDVIDLGKDVSPDEIADALEKSGAPILGLSALMTTTVPNMEETVRLVHQRFPKVKTIVGGAVLNLEYAQMIGADKYAADAMECVRYAEIIYNSL